MGLKVPHNIPPLDSTEATPSEEKLIAARLFALGGAATWLIAEYDYDEMVAFGYADLFGQGASGGAEWGYICISELQDLRFLGIPRVEVDLHFRAKRFAECVRPDGTII